MVEYFCGNPICKRTITTESTDWPLRCDHCNQQCYPENFQAAGSSSGNSSLLTQDDGFRLPGTLLMVRGPTGTLIPFRYSRSPQTPIEPLPNVVSDASRSASVSIAEVLETGDFRANQKRQPVEQGPPQITMLSPEVPPPAVPANVRVQRAQRVQVLKFLAVLLLMAAIVALVNFASTGPRKQPQAISSAISSPVLPPSNSARPPKQIPPSAKGSPSLYAQARTQFRTHLLKIGAAPQRYEIILPPPGTQEISYSSGALTLRAWVSDPPTNGQRRPAVLFLHGGFAFGEEDWEMTKPYRDAGFVVLSPMLRGENGLPGKYSMFLDEIDDVLAAADTLASLPYVQKDHIYLAGHSVGGTLAILAAMSSGRFRAVASFSGSPDQTQWSANNLLVVPFDLGNDAELRIRSPIEYATSFQCPTRLYYGAAEQFFATSTTKLSELAQLNGLDVQAVPVAGNHMSHVAESMRRSIEFFREKQ